MAKQGWYSQINLLTSPYPYFWQGMPYPKSDHDILSELFVLNVPLPF